MSDLFEAIRTAVHQYMNMDDLSPRRKKLMQDTYGKFVYDIDTVDSLLEIEVEETDAEK